MIRDLAGAPAVWAVGVLSVVCATWAVAHIVLTKRDVRAAIGWTGFVVVFPLLGPALYLSLGINHLNREVRVRGGSRRGSPAGRRRELDDELPPSALRPAMPPHELAPLAFLGGRVVDRPLLGGNVVEPLVGGDRAYPEMLAAIASADRSIALCTYIFDDDRSGREFVDALAVARERGVEVRVLVDAVGARYSRPVITRRLGFAGVRVALFMPTRIPIFQPHSNLRTHRKILVVDGRTAFVGGMNIREGHRMERAEANRIQDLHFRIEGPIVSRLQQVLAGDWAFSTGEELRGDLWFPPVERSGSVLARVIPDGPDEDLDKARWTILGAVAEAESRVRIFTPYFLPDSDLITAINVASLRGVKVEIVLPAVNNLPFVHWAVMAQLEQVMEHGAEVFLSPPPFDHTKLLLVGTSWALIGSTNLDPRSLRLNFEINVELYDAELGRVLDRLAEEKIAASRPLTREDLASRRLAVKLRDGLARLAMPYL